MASNVNMTGVNTSDATATAAKIFPGYTAYVNGEKVIGTGTSDATATAAQILSGYSAYVNGSKIIGNMAVPAIKYQFISGEQSSSYYASSDAISQASIGDFILVSATWNTSNVGSPQISSYSGCVPNGDKGSYALQITQGNWYASFTLRAGYAYFMVYRLYL